MALGLTAAASLGRFELQVCRECSRVQYPPREACSFCLSGQLDWRIETGLGELLAQTTLSHSHEPYFKERLPWRIGLVRLDSGPIVITHMDRTCPDPPVRVRVGARLDEAGVGVLIAFPVETGGVHDE